MNIHIYVEGGSPPGQKNASSLDNECRQAFRRFFEKAGFENPTLRISACGRRNNANKQFREAISKRVKGVFPILLVDSESPVFPGNSAWQHLKECDGKKWEKPSNATQEHAHLMVQCMEAWIVVDIENLKKFYGQDFNPKSLPSPSRRIEEVPKEELIKSLKNATKDSKTKGKYHKGNHSFKLLGTINPK